MSVLRCACLVLLLYPLSAWPDLRVVAREYLNHRPTVTTTHWFGTDKSVRDDGRVRTIMRFDLNRQYIVDPHAKTYRSLELEPAEPLKVLLVRTDDLRRVGSWTARRWRIDGPAAAGYTINIWATTDIPKHEGFVALMQKLARQPGAEWLHAYARIDGFPIVQEISLTERGLSQTRRSEVATVVEMKPPDYTYLPPRGYKRIP